MPPRPSGEKNSALRQLDSSVWLDREQPVFESSATAIDVDEVVGMLLDAAEHDPDAACPDGVAPILESAGVFGQTDSLLDPLSACGSGLEHEALGYVEIEKPIVAGWRGGAGHSTIEAGPDTSRQGTVSRIREPVR